MGNEVEIYICPVCFQVCETERECHQHKMLACNTGQIGDARRKPVTNNQGRIVSRAPRWYAEAVGWLPSENQ